MIEQLQTWCPHDISACPALFCTQPQGFSLQRPHQAVLQAIIHLLPEYYSIKCQRRPKLHSGAWTESLCSGQHHRAGLRLEDGDTNVCLCLAGQ